MISELTNTAAALTLPHNFKADKTTTPKRKQKRLKLWILLLLITLLIIYTITQYPRGYYRSPLSIKAELAANFGELRPDHFHMGLDIRTKGKENLSVYAAAEGFISRISIEENGFGKAIFIDHPNGTTTVYAHLNCFNEKLENAVKENQYKTKSWPQDMHFTKDMFPVSRGAFIGKSGNTGASEGPHLHFEIRDTKTGKNLNPLTAGFNITDDNAPVIKSLYWYDRGGSIYESSANPFNRNIKLLKVNAPFIGFATEALDQMDNTHFKMGIYKAEILTDNILQHRFALDSFSYAETRYVNACMDYQNLMRNKQKIQYLFRLPGNHLPVYKGSPGNGTLDISDRRMHQVKIMVSDVAGNRDSVIFMVQYDGSVQRHKSSLIKPLVPGIEQQLTTNNATVSFNKNTFYDAAAVAIAEEPGKSKNAASSVIHLSAPNVPLHDNFKVTIKSNPVLTYNQRKHIIMELNSLNNRYFFKGIWNENFMTGSFDKTGAIRLIIDSAPPSIHAIEYKNVYTEDDQSISFLYADNIPVTGYFNAELDGRWLLFEQKKNRFTYWFDEHCGKGRHQLKITVTDIAGNTTVKTFAFEKK